MSSDSDDAALQGLHMALADAIHEREEVRRQLAETEARIKRLQTSIGALTGDGGVGRHIRSGAAVLAALATCPTPVTSRTLMKHPDLAHYSEPTIRRALTTLHTAGRVVSIERTPKGHLWEAVR